MAKNGKFKKCIYVTLRFILKIFFRAFRVEVRGIEHYHAAGERALILPNHVSLLDPLLLALYLPDPPLFVINLFIARTWLWLRPFLSLVRTWHVDPTKPFAMKSLVTELKKGGRCVIFPEGRITTTGALMRIYDGAAMAADKTGAVLLPIHIDGVQFSKFSYLAGKFPLRWFPKITLTFLPPRSLEIPEEARGRKRRELVQIFLNDLMHEAAFQAKNHRKTIFQALLEARDLYGRGRVVTLEPTHKKANYGKLIAASLVLGDMFAPETREGENVGILLPNSIATVALFIGLSYRGRVPAMLNYSLGVKNILACSSAASVSTVVTSRRFVEAGKFESLIEAMRESGLKIIWLEDFAGTKINVYAKIGAWLRERFMSASRVKGDPDSPAFILFTSGSEGAPKGVVLSHANLISSLNQLTTIIDFCPSDIAMNAMPLFHIFGSLGTFLPLFWGIKTLYYPTPLHYRLIPLISYDIDATIIFGADTFLYGYARGAHPYDFYNVRYVFVGAEKLRERTRALWGEKFGIRLIEGYGTTETSIISANTNLLFGAETVGRLVPGMIARIEPVPGIEDGGQLYVKGPNVMLGYLKAGKPGVIQPPENGWHDTGDIIHTGRHGFITIKGRAKRFAKVGGEMVSLAALEEDVERVWPGARHAVVASEDERRGEKLILITEKQDAARDDLIARMKSIGYMEVLIPKKILIVPKLPLLGSGKTNYPEAAELAGKYSRETN